eukprot:5239511-Amphidinium_carterae.1
MLGLTVLPPSNNPSASGGSCSQTKAASRWCQAGHGGGSGCTGGMSGRHAAISFLRLRPGWGQGVQKLSLAGHPHRTIRGLVLLRIRQHHLIRILRRRNHAPT